MTNIYALNVFVRYVPTGSNLVNFYRDVVGLPLLRTYGAAPADLYWGGEASIFETVEIAGKGLAPEPDADAASLVPIFRTPDLAAALAELNGKGLSAARLQEGARGLEAYFLDPVGRLFALREAPLDSLRPEDVEARRRLRRGEAFNPGCGPMPPSIQELGWIVRRCADLDRQTLFYEQALKLPRLSDLDDRRRFDLGDNVVLELAPGGRALADAAERYDNTDAVILRASDTPALRRSAVQHHGRVVTEKLNIYWADLAFIADPEGGVFGLEQAFHPGEYAPGRLALSENLEALRRWRERR